MHKPQSRSVLRQVKNRATMILMASALGLIACDGSAEPAEAEQRPAAAAVHTPPSSTEEVLFDIPALMGKSIDQVREALGTPQNRAIEPTQLQLDVGIHEWSNVFTHNGQDLLVTFHAPTRRVVDFFLDGTDQKALMLRGNLDEHSSAYRVQSVRARRDPSQITGVTITPSR